MQEIKVFAGNFGEVRTVVIDGEPWFVGKDVATALGYVDPKAAISKKVDSEDKQIIQSCQNGNLEIPNRGLSIINESGLYSLILSSKLESAKKFKRWITSEVIPAIRKTGSYSVSSDIPKRYSDIKGVIEVFETTARVLKMNDNSVLSGMHTIYNKHGLDTELLPQYTESKDQLLSATELLKRNNINISAVKFNKIMLENGLLEERERPSSKGGTKKFKALVNLTYGENQVSPKNPKETQALYYASKFNELCNRLGI